MSIAPTPMTFHKFVEIWCVSIPELTNWGFSPSCWCNSSLKKNSINFCPGVYTRNPTVALTASPSCTLWWHIKKGKMMVIAINRLPAASCLPDAIHCVCKTGYNTRHCGYCKYELECSLSFGGCKGLHCLNITLPEVGKSYIYLHNNYIETILFSHKVKVNMSV